MSVIEANDANGFSASQQVKKVGEEISAHGYELTGADITNPANTQTGFLEVGDVKQIVAQVGVAAAQAVVDSRSEIEDLKNQINDSFAEVISLISDLNNRLDLLDERISIYNSRSSHKI